jgi:hypothetical protein
MPNSQPKHLAEHGSRLSREAAASLDVGEGVLQDANRQLAHSEAAESWHHYGA